MGDVKCRECGEAVLVTDATCPHCWQVLDQELLNRQHRNQGNIAAVILYLMVGGVVAGLLLWKKEPSELSQMEGADVKVVRVNAATDAFLDRPSDAPANKRPDKAPPSAIVEDLLLNREVITVRDDGLNFVPIIIDEHAAKAALDGEMPDLSKHVIEVELGTRAEVVRAEELLWVRVKEGKHQGVIGAISTDFVTLTGR